ncbi:hypothetical protein SISNIDRAFT_64619 [Sistotremastrum niveocremeum HHB9708]|uniref:G-protein coupled receptors family 1 profile domain-containing protein n=2 Tax=Sistotremastraceae TaxID=3402574 RepID=A0A164UY81_9AGAM|nr:hypothetical protein SISNIDRAFT_64619 [Sistotremastrum niveocremeum HHB9708]KZT34593.1 hypothetical protein SISSUDRAFT_269228 [Sistotremastrum suecicum HHB10207 ss-3]
MYISAGSNAVLSQYQDIDFSGDENLVQGSQPLLVLYLVFQISDQILLPVLIGTLVFSNGVKRHPTLINLCITWLIAGVVGSLLFYAGHQTGPEPPPDLCIIQASLIYALTPMTSTSILCLVFQAWASITNFRFGENHPIIRSATLLILPYVSFIAFGTATLILASTHTGPVNRNRKFFYCSLDNKTFGYSIAVFCGIILTATFIMEAWIAATYYKNWRTLKSSAQGQHTLRLLMLGFWIFTALSLSGLSFVRPRSPVPDLLISSSEHH